MHERRVLSNNNNYYYRRNPPFGRPSRGMATGDQTSHCRVLKIMEGQSYRRSTARYRAQTTTQLHVVIVCHHNSCDSSCTNQRKLQQQRHQQLQIVLPRLRARATIVRSIGYTAILRLLKEGCCGPFLSTLPSAAADPSATAAAEGKAKVIAGKGFARQRPRRQQLLLKRPR
jgi:hypothetical protein